MGIFNKKSKPTKLQSLDELQPMLDSGKPVLLDLMQVNCGPCRIMDGVVNELAAEFGDSAHIVKVDVTKVPGAAQAFGIRSPRHSQLDQLRRSSCWAGPTSRFRRRRSAKARLPRSPLTASHRVGAIRVS